MRVDEMKMDLKNMLMRIKTLYDRENINIIEYLKSLDGKEENSLEDILISYDFQAGTYIDNYRSNKDYHNMHLERLISVIDALDCKKDSIFECGVGEGTTLIPVINALKSKFVFSGGGRYLVVADEICTIICR